MNVDYEVVKDDPVPPRGIEVEWAEYLSMRRKGKKPATPYAQLLAIKKLEKYSKGDIEIKKAILNKSIERNWEGLFPLNEQDLREVYCDRTNRTYEVEL